MFGFGKKRVGGIPKPIPPEPSTNPPPRVDPENDPFLDRILDRDALKKKREAERRGPEGGGSRR
jgi:hypothetical protein